MRQGLDAATLALYQSREFDTHIQFSVANGSGTFVNLHGRIQHWSYAHPDPNNTVGMLDVTLIREATGKGSLAPFVTSSTLNRLDDGVTYSPLLLVGRRHVFKVALTAVGAARPAENSTLWYEVHSGRLIKVSWPQYDSRVMRIQCLDLAGELSKVKSEVAYTYAVGTPFETVAQQILNNNGYSSLTMYVPAPTGKVLEVAYAPGLQKSIWEQLSDVAKGMAWQCWVRYKPDNTPAITLFNPDRNRITTDLTIERVDNWTNLEVDENQIRNVGYVQYTDANGVRQMAGPVVDNDSIAKYGGFRRPFWISYAPDSPVRTADAANNILNTAIADVKDPDAEASAAMGCLIFAEPTIDRYLFQEDDRFYTGTLTLTVFAISTSQTGYEQPKSDPQLRGRASAGFRHWLRNPFTDDGNTGFKYVQTLSRIIASDETTVTVQVDASPNFASVMLVDTTGSTSIISGASVMTPVPSGSTWVLARGAETGPVGQAQFRGTADGHVPDDHVTVVPQQGRDTVPLTMLARVWAAGSDKDNVSVRVYVADPYPSANITIQHTAVGTGAVTPASPLTIPAASVTSDITTTGFVQILIPKPEFGSPTGRVALEAFATGRLQAVDAVDVPTKDKDTTSAPITLELDSANGNYRWKPSAFDDADGSAVAVTASGPVPAFIYNSSGALLGSYSTSDGTPGLGAPGVTLTIQPGQSVEFWRATWVEGSAEPPQRIARFSATTSSGGKASSVVVLPPMLAMYGGTGPNAGTQGRVLRVNQVSGGEHTTITDAINAAVAAGANVNSRWVIFVSAGNYAENVTVPAGVIVLGAGMRNSTVIVGMLTLHSGGAVDALSVIPAVNAATVGVRTVFDIAGAATVPLLSQIYCKVDTNVDAPVTALEMTGTAYTYLEMANCSFYARNPNAGVNAVAAVVRIVPGVTGYLEWHGGHPKTSTGGGAKAKLVWNQSSAATAYAQIEGKAWSPVYAAAPYLVYNENPNHPGALLDVGIIPGAVVTEPQIYSVSAQYRLGLPDKYYRILKVTDRIDLDGQTILGTSRVLQNLTVPAALLTGTVDDARLPATVAKIAGAAFTGGISAPSLSLAGQNLVPVALAGSVPAHVGLNAGFQPTYLAVNRLPSTSALSMVGGTHPGTAAALYGFYNDVTFPTTAATGVSGVFNRVRTANTAGTIGIVSVLEAQFTKGAASTVTNLYGLFVGNMAGATNNFAIYTGTGVVRFGDTLNLAGATPLQVAGTTVLTATRDLTNIASLVATSGISGASLATSSGTITGSGDAQLNLSNTAAGFLTGTGGALQGRFGSLAVGSDYAVAPTHVPSYGIAAEGYITSYGAGGGFLLPNRPGSGGGGYGWIQYVSADVFYFWSAQHSVNRLSLSQAGDLAVSGSYAGNDGARVHLSNAAAQFYNSTGGAIQGRFASLVAANDYAIGAASTPANGIYSLGGLVTTGNVSFTGDQSINWNAYGGGFRMVDTTWIRTVNDKGLWLGAGNYATDGRLSLGYSGAVNTAFRAQINGAVIVENGGLTVSGGNIASWEARIGRHPNFATPYVGFWKDAQTYALLTDGGSTFLNGSLSVGIRVANDPRIIVEPTMTTLNGDLFNGNGHRLAATIVTNTIPQSTDAATVGTLWCVVS